MLLITFDAESARLRIQLDRIRAYMRWLNWIRELNNAARSADAQAVAGLLAERLERRFADEERVASATAALATVASAGAIDCLQLLLPHSDPKASNDFGATPLMLAAGAGHTECVRALLPLSDAKAIVPLGNLKALPPMTLGDVLGPAPGQTALILAARHGHAPCVDLLLPASDANVRDASGLTAIEHATQWGHVKCADLLACDSDPDLADAAVKKFGSLAMPRFLAHQESAELRAEMTAQERSQGDARPESAPVAARRL